MRTGERARLSEGEGDGMRTAISALATVAIVAAAQPAGAIDNEFRGWYRVMAQNWCPGADSDRVQVR
jgi:hypothetical protein